MILVTDSERVDLIVDSGRARAAFQIGDSPEPQADVRHFGVRCDLSRAQNQG